VQAVIVLFFGILGAFLFAYLTGKGTELNSSIFLTLIVAITVGQATYNIVKEQSLSLFQNHFATIFFVCGMVTYGNLQGVTILMSDMPMVVPLSLSAIEIAFGMLFLGFFL
jgi:NAD(P)H-quinone oxidoreductase subunit 5